MLEGFLLRLAQAPDRNRLVLKGGVLLAAYHLRRQTADIDIAAIRVPNELPAVRQLVVDVAGFALPAQLDDGLSFDLSAVRAEAIREEDVYGGVLVRLRASLATAREPFHVDVNVGDPIWPAPREISLPRLLDQEPIRLMGYSMEMILAEKVVTSIQRGQANTRWRDFADIYLLTGRHAFRAGQVRQALQAVANHRNVELMGIRGALTGYAEISQSRWAAMAQQTPVDDHTPNRIR